MKIIRYAFVGGTAASIDLLVFFVAVKVYYLNWFFVAFISFIIATIVNYRLSVKFVFESGKRFGSRTELCLVFLVSGVGLTLNQASLWWLIEIEHIDEIIAKVLAITLIFAWNYTLRSCYIFKPRE